MHYNFRYPQRKNKGKIFFKIIDSYQADYLSSQKLTNFALHTSCITAQARTFKHKNREDAAAHMVLCGLIKVDSWLRSVPTQALLCM